EAKGMSITFHRAFDECRNPSEALEQIISLGCDRLLTSGHAPSVSEGLELLKRMVIQAGERIIILPGCGVTPENAPVIMEATGTREIHGSLRRNGHTDKKMVRQTLLAINAESLA
ncbi:MAG: copper homeostasis protein CutC, partial [Bacteroidaceae bacterium]|nr:copper homeostasis protein CutC [Bacteroidaceae bacterium]